MTVLVTGSAGFVGFHTSVKLKELGAGVLGIDNVNDYYPVSLKRARLAKLESLGVHTLEADLNDKHAVRKALDACRSPTCSISPGASRGSLRRQEPGLLRPL